MSDLADQLRLLEDARARILDPKHWTQNVIARNAAGEETGEDQPDAVCWCALGSIYRSAYELGIGPGTRSRAHRLLARPRALITTNDDMGHAAVIDLFDQTIADVRAAIQKEGGDLV